MRKVLKWLGIGLAGLIGLIVLAAVVLSLVGGARLNKKHAIQGEAITIPTDAEGLARGEHLVNIACKSCHGEDLSGQALLEDPAIGTVYATNISGISESHSDEEIVRAIRHGVDTDGRQLMIMPAEAFIHFSEEDLGAIIAYLKTIPRQGEDTPDPKLTFMARILLALGMFGDVFPAEYIDHNMAFPARPEIGANVAYGEYLAAFCTSCHGADLGGGQPADPASPLAPNLTPGGELGSWSEADFFQVIRTGVTPSGHKINPEFMPFDSFAKFDEDELRGLWMYLESLPAVESSAK